jgi:hypothetical protein
VVVQHFQSMTRPAVPYTMQTELQNVEIVLHLETVGDYTIHRSMGEEMMKDGARHCDLLHGVREIRDTFL